MKFVDVVNNFEAYVRCDCEESAKKIAEENRWPQTNQLKGNYAFYFIFIQSPYLISIYVCNILGEEEKLYWEKILHDREIKCTKQKGAKKQRGRVKLINKAEKKLAQHVKFDDIN